MSGRARSAALWMYSSTMFERHRSGQRLAVHRLLSHEQPPPGVYVATPGVHSGSHAAYLRPHRSHQSWWIVLCAFFLGPGAISWLAWAVAPLFRR